MLGLIGGHVGGILVGFRWSEKLFETRGKVHNDFIFHFLQLPLNNLFVEWGVGTGKFQKQGRHYIYIYICIVYIYIYTRMVLSVSLVIIHTYMLLLYLVPYVFPIYLRELLTGKFHELWDSL